MSYLIVVTHEDHNADGEFLIRAALTRHFHTSVTAVARGWGESAVTRDATGHDQADRGTRAILSVS